MDSVGRGLEGSVEKCPLCWILFTKINNVGWEKILANQSVYKEFVFFC